MAGARHDMRQGIGMGTACYVWISLNSVAPLRIKTCRYAGSRVYDSHFTIWFLQDVNLMLLSEISGCCTNIDESTIGYDITYLSQFRSRFLPGLLCAEDWASTYLPKRTWPWHSEVGARLWTPFNGFKPTRHRHMICTWDCIYSFYVLLMMGAESTWNTYSNLAVDNK